MVTNAESKIKKYQIFKANTNKQLLLLLLVGVAYRDALICARRSIVWLKRGLPAVPPPLLLALPLPLQGITKSTRQRVSSSHLDIDNQINADIAGTFYRALFSPTPFPLPPPPPAAFLLLFLHYERERERDSAQASLSHVCLLLLLLYIFLTLFLFSLALLPWEGAPTTTTAATRRATTTTRRATRQLSLMVFVGRWCHKFLLVRGSEARL